MNDTIVQFGGWIVAIVVAVITAAVQWRKGSVDESALVLGKWKDLVDAHQSQIGTLNAEIESLRKRLAANEVEFSQYRRETEKRMRSLEDENAGLRRMIAQNSQSAAWAIGNVKRAGTENAADMADLTARMDEAGHNSDRAASDEGGT